MTKTIHSPEYGRVIERLKQSRVDAGLSQQEVAKRLKKPQSYISKIESGERRLDVIEIKKLAEMYKKTIDYLIN